MTKLKDKIKSGLLTVFLEITGVPEEGVELTPNRDLASPLPFWHPAGLGCYLDHPTLKIDVPPFEVSEFPFSHPCMKKDHQDRPHVGRTAPKD